MKRNSPSEAILTEEIMKSSQQLKKTLRGLSIGALIKLIRLQLGMSQKIVAKRAKVPQSTVSRIEQGKNDITLSTLNKILNALSSDLIIAPLLRDSVQSIRRKQAKKIVAKQVDYLVGTMHLEGQEPDTRFIEELTHQEEERLLQGPNSKLWEEHG